MPQHEISGTVYFDIGDKVLHQTRGEGIVVKWKFEASNEGSERVRRGFETQYFVVSFNGDWRKCQLHEIKAI